MEGEAIASRVLELGPAGAKFLGPVIIEVPHFASLRGKEREIVILRSDNGESWREHTLEATEEAVQEVLQESFDEGGKVELFNVCLFTVSFNCRHVSAGGLEHEPNHADPDDGLPPVLRHHLPDPAGGPRYRTGGRGRQQLSRAAGPGRLPQRRPHQEDQSGPAGKHVQTKEGSRGQSVKKDLSQSCS